MATITLEDLHTYHSIDREIFSRLVLTLSRRVGESLLVMAAWLWLEDMGFPSIIVKMRGRNDDVVGGLAEEAVRCLESLKPEGISNEIFDSNLPLTSRVMEVNSISLEVFYLNRFTAISGIKNFLNTVCARIFTDILQRVLTGSSRGHILNRPLIIPDFPHPIFGNVRIVPRFIDHSFPIGGLWGWEPNNNVTEDDRTMFLTFSRGFPVTKLEVEQLFISTFGDCVVHVQMQETANSEQPLFARMILQNVGYVDQILAGQRISKFRINGKHIWARRYERRE